MYRDAKALGIEGRSAAEVAAVLSAITVKPMSLPVVSAWLQQHGLLKRNREQAWVGSLVQVASDEFQAKLDSLIEHMLLPGVTTIDTTKEPFAMLAAGMVSVCVALGILTGEQVTELYSFGGGKKFPDGVTATQWEAVLASQALDDALLEVQQRSDAAIEAAAAAKRSADATRGSIMVAAESAWHNWSGGE